MAFHKNVCALLIFIDQSQFSTENINGPYGPYEHILWDILAQICNQITILDKNWKIRMSKIPEYAFWENKKPLWGGPETENGSE